MNLHPWLQAQRLRIRDVPHRNLPQCGQHHITPPKQQAPTPPSQPATPKAPAASRDSAQTLECDKERSAACQDVSI